jgi:hypothetical protein
VAQVGPRWQLENKDHEEENLEPAPISAAPRVDGAPVHITDHTDGPPPGERVRRMIEPVLKALREVG